MLHKHTSKSAPVQGVSLSKKNRARIAEAVAPKTPQPLVPIHDRVFLTPQQLSQRWLCSIMKLRRMRAAGKLRVFYIGRSARYSLDDVLHLESQAAA